MKNDFEDAALAAIASLPKPGRPHPWAGLTGTLVPLNAAAEADLKRTRKQKAK